MEPEQLVLCDSTLTCQENWSVGKPVNITTRHERIVKHKNASNFTWSLEMFKVLIKWDDFYFIKWK